MTFDAEYFRALHRLPGVGESYRWFQALPSSAIDPRRNQADAGISDGRDLNNRLYVEQAVDPLWKAKVSHTTRQITDAQFGVLTVGATQISVMPDETNVARMDKIILTQRNLSTAHTVIRDGEATGTLLDVLERPFVLDIERVFDSGQDYVLGVDFKLTPDASAQKPCFIEWLGAGRRPDVGDSYSVGYTYHPVYVHLDDQVRIPRPDANGVLLPLRFIATEELPTGAL